MPAERPPTDHLITEEPRITVNQTTDPTAPEAAASAAEPQPPLRDALMHALAATEAVISRLGVMPIAVTLTEHRGVYGISLHYFQDPGAVRAFASALGLDEVITSPNRRTYNTWLTEATAYIEGIPVHGWTQTEDLPLTAAGEVSAPTDMVPAAPTSQVLQVTGHTMTPVEVARAYARPAVQTLAQAAGQVSA